MRKGVIALAAALFLATGPALAGGEGGSSPFSQKAPAPGADPGFETAAAFFQHFLQGRGVGLYPGNKQGSLEGFARVVVFAEERRESNYYKVYQNRPQSDPAAERKIYDAMNRIVREFKEELGLNSPKAAANLAPADDPDALPGLDY